MKYRIGANRPPDLGRKPPSPGPCDSRLAGRIEIAGGKESQVSDLGPVPPAFDYADYIHEFPIRGFNFHPNGKSFLTSVSHGRSQTVLMRGFDRSPRPFDWFLR